MIPKFIKNNHINMNDYEKKDYKSFNDFFTRKIKEGKRKINDDKYNLISPCDAKLKVYKLTKTGGFKFLQERSIDPRSLSPLNTDKSHISYRQIKKILKQN